MECFQATGCIYQQQGMQHCGSFSLSIGTIVSDFCYITIVVGVLTRLPVYGVVFMSTTTWDTMYAVYMTSCTGAGKPFNAIFCSVPPVLVAQ